MKERDESPPEVKPEKSAEPGEKRATGAREKAIREFMDSFESEFRIPPTRIVEAMASIEPQKLNESPDETAADVVEQLDLKPEDREKAMAMYAGLLSQLQGIDRAARPVVPTENAMMAPQVRERFLQAKDRRAAMSSAVDNLNQKFWMTDTRASAFGRGQQQGVMAQAFDPNRMQIANDANADMSETMGDESLQSLGEDSLETLPLGTASRSAKAEPGELPQGERSQAPGLRGARTATPEAMKRVLNEMRMAAEQAKVDQALQSANAIESEGESDVQVLGATAMPKMNGAQAVKGEVADAASAAKSFMVNSMPQKGHQAGGFGQGQSGFGSSGNSKGDKDSGSSGDMKSLGALGSSAPVPLKLEDVAAALKAQAPGAAPSIIANTQDHEGNIRQIMNQAQYLIKKGGGEVKVEMSPEGLGNLHLKVLVQDGKVNVQMAAESNEARKAIESSLPELRSSLAAHKLSMDHVKVDVVSAPSTDNQARNDMNNPNPQNRETRQFWNQFQDNFGNRGAREGLWDMPDMRNYRQSKAVAALEPTGEARVASSPSKRADGRGNGLNLVA